MPWVAFFVQAEEIVGGAKVIITTAQLLQTLVLTKHRGHREQRSVKIFVEWNKFTFSWS